MAEEVYKSPEVFKKPIKLPKVENSEVATTAPQEDPVYRKKVYTFLKRELGDFKLTEDEFYKKLDSDQAYAPKVYSFLKNNFSDFTKPEQDFLFLMTPSKKKDEIKPKEEIPVITLTEQGELPTQPAQPPTPSPTKPSPELRTSGEVPAAPSPSASPLPSDGKFKFPEGDELDLNDPLRSLYIRANPIIQRERPSDISMYGAIGPAPLPEKADEKEGLKQKDYEDFKTLFQTDPTYALAHLSKATGKTEQELLAAPFAQIDAFARPLNETDKISIQTLKRIKSAQRSSDPNNWINGKWSAERAAIAYASETDPDKGAFIRQYMQPVSITKPDGTVEKTTIYGNPKEIFKDAEATLGTLVSNYLNDPINEAVAMSGPFAEQFKQAKKDFAKNYPKTAAVMVGNKISQAYEKSGERGYLSRFAQMNTPGLMKEMDELAKDLLAKGEMSQEEYDVYLNQVRGNEQYLDVPSVVEQIGLGGGAAFAGIKSTFTQPFTSTSKTQLEAWEEEASNVSANPKGFWKFANDAAHMGGFVMGMSATGGLLGGGQGLTQGLMGTTRALSPTAMNMTNAGLIFFGDNLKAGKLKYPNDPAKAIASAGFNTALFMALAKDLFPTKQVESAIRTITPQVDQVVNQLTTGAITREAAKAQTRNIFTKTFETLSAATKQNVKASSEMAAISLLDRGLDKLMGLDQQKYDQYHGRNAELEAFTNMFMGNAGVAAWAGYGKMRYKNRAAIESYYDAAKRPNFYRKVVSEGEGTPEAKSEILENIKFVETLKAELESLGMSESKQKAYIANAMAEKVMLGKESADPNLQKKNQGDASEIQKDQEELLKNPGEEIELTDDGFTPLGKPTKEQELKDIKEGNLVTFTYKNESEVPEPFKDKISSKGEINGEPYVRVTVAKSLADYELAKAGEVAPEVPQPEQQKESIAKAVKEAGYDVTPEQLDRIYDGVIKGDGKIDANEVRRILNSGYIGADRAAEYINELGIKAGEVSPKVSKPKASEPTSVTSAEDGSTFVRMPDGSYTDGDQIYNSWNELKEMGEREGFNFKESTKEKEEEIRSSETVKEILNEIDEKQKFQEKLDVWNYINDEVLRRMGYESPMEMTEVDRSIQANLVKQGVEAFEKNQLNTISEANEIINSGLSKEVSPSSKESGVKINDVIDRAGTYKGQKGRFYLDGQTVVFDVEGSNKEYEIGNVNEIGAKSITEFGVEAEGKVVETNEAGNVVVRGEEFVNLFSDPAQAINRNKEGEVVSVNLETADGKKRTFRGDVAKDIAAEIEQGRVAGAKIPEGEVPAQKVPKGEVAPKEEVPKEFGEVKIIENADGTFTPYLEVSVKLPTETTTISQPIKSEVKKFETREEAQEIGNKDLLNEWNKSQAGEVAPKAPQPKTIEQQKVEQDAETERLMGGEAEKNRKSGRYVKDGVEYVRNEQGQGEYSDRKGEVRFTNEVSVPFRYKLVEAETVQPSHSGGVRNPNHFIPEAQPKSRLDKGSIMAEEGFANNPRFDELGENTNAFSGAPVVNQRNEVVQGNNRAAGLKKGYERNNPAYKEALKAAAIKFGFSPAQVEAMKNPILVREVAVSDAGAIELGNYDVKDLETGGKRRLDPIAVTRRMPMDAKKRLAELLFGGEGTVNQSLRNNFDRVMEILKPLLNQAQRNTLMNKEGNLTEAGAKDIEAVGQQLLFDNGDPALPDLFENLSQTQKEGIRKSLQHIFAGGSDKNLVREVQNAILGLNDFAASGAKDLKQWMSQTDLLRGGKTPRDIYTPLELKMVEILNEAKSQAAIKEKFSAFENAIVDKEADMFEPAKKGKSKEEAVKEIFKPEEAPKEAPKVESEVPQPKESKKGAEEKPKTKVKETKVYHFTDENISDFDESKGGVWLTTNSAGYPLKRGLKNKVERTINEKELNFATEKQVFQAGGGDYKKGLEELKKQGYDGVKRTVDGDKEFYIYDKSKLKIPDERKAETTGKRGGAKVGGEPKGEVPTAEGGEPAKPTEKGKYTKKAEQIAKEIMKAELPSWLKGAELPPGTEKMGPSLPSEEAIKKALANAVIKMGKLLDRGVEFSQAVKEATRNLVKLMGEDKAKGIQNNFTDYYNQKNAIPKQTAGQVPIQPKAGAGEKVEGGTPGAEPKKPTEKGEGKGEKKEVTIERKKAFLNAIINAKGTPKAAKEGLEEKGLKYQTKSQKEAADLAESIIASQGIDAAVEFAEKETLDGDVNALVMMKALEKLSDLEASASSPAEKQQYAIRFSEIADAFDNKARSKGRFNSAINFFYKKSPLGIVINENNKRKERFEEWASERTITGESKEQSWKDFYENIEEVLQDPTVAKIISERIAEGVEAAKPKAEATAKPAEAKAGDPLRKFAAAIRKGRISKLGGFKAGTGFDAVWDASVEVVAKAVEGGATLADAIQAGIRYVRSTGWYANLTNKSDFEDKFREHFESEYAKEKENQKKAERYLNNLKKKLSGLSAKERDAAVKRAFEKIVESGGLDYQEFRDIIGEVTGRGSLTDAEAQKMKDLVEKTNAIEVAAERVRTERTPEALKAYRVAELEAAKATAELQEMLDTNPNIFDRLTSIMQLNTLGIPALINNPIYNIWNQTTVRFPVGLVNTLVDQSLAKAFKAVGKNYVPETNILNAQVQAEFFKKLGLGAKESFTQLLTGLNRQDYIQKELTTQKIQPLKSLKSLYRSLTGKEKLTKSQKIDKALQATVGLPAEIVARVLNTGDKPQRFAAEAATASTFAQQLGLKDIDYEIFIEFPREEAYRELRNQGLSESEASQRADYIKEAVIQEGKRSTFQQDNILNDMLNSIFSNKSFLGTGNLVKSIAVSPYIKIPANAYWSYYNMVNPEVALLQSMIYGARSAKTDGVKSKMAAREAKYWFGHAVVGVATRAVVLALVQQGIFNPGSSKEETKKEREGKSDFIRQGTIDIDKLSAVLRGDNPNEVSGGTLVPLKYLGHWGTIGNTIAKKYEEMTPEQRKAQLRFWDAAIGGMELDAVQELQEGIFSNTSSLLSALQDDKSLRRYGMNVVNLLTNIVHPAAVAQVERAALPYQSTVKADNFMDELKNNFLQRSFFLRKILDKEPPAKIGIWGDQLDRKENLVLRWFGISKENKDNFAYPIWELVKKTGDIGYFPPAVLPRLNDQELTVKQTSELQELVGKARKVRVAPYLNNQAEIEGFDDADGKPLKFKDLNDDIKKFVLNYLYELGRVDGVYQFYLANPELDPKNEFRDELDEELKARKAAFRQVNYYKGRPEAQLEKMMEDRLKK